MAQPLDPDNNGSLPGEDFSSYLQRLNSGVTTDQAQQVANDQDQRNQAATAKAYSSQGIASYTDSTGAMKAITAVPGGPPLQGDGSNGGLVYGQDGSPQRVKFAGLDNPTLVDPYSPEGGGSTQTDKAGNTYATSPGAPWKWTGTDPAAQAQAQADAQDQAFKEQKAALDEANGVFGQQVSQAKTALAGHQKALEGNTAALQGIPELASGDFDPDDPDAATKLPKAFAPVGDEYNEKPFLGSIIGGAQLTPAAQQARADLAQRQQQAQALLAQRQQTQAQLDRWQSVHDTAAAQQSSVLEQRATLARQRLQGDNLPTGSADDDAFNTAQAAANVPGSTAASQTNPTGNTPALAGTAGTPGTSMGNPIDPTQAAAPLQRGSSVIYNPTDGPSRTGTILQTQPGMPNAIVRHDADPATGLPAQNASVPVAYLQHDPTADPNDLTAPLPGESPADFDARRASVLASRAAAAQQQQASVPVGGGSTTPNSPAAPVGQDGQPGTPTKPYSVSADGSLSLDPLHMADGLLAANKDGVVDDAKLKDLLPGAIAAEKAAQAQADLQQRVSADDWAKAKAVATGASRGATFLAAAGPGAEAGAAIGAAIPVLGETGVGEFLGGAIGGLASGYAGSKAASAVGNELAQHSATLKSFADASQALPQYDAAGNLVSFIIPGAAGLANLGRVGAIRAAEMGVPAALKLTAKEAGTQAAGGAIFEGAIRPAFDWVLNQGKQALGLGGDPNDPANQVQAPTVSSVLQNAILGAALGNLGTKFKGYDAGEIAGLYQRAVQGEKLTTGEASALQAARDEMNARAAKGETFITPDFKLQVQQALNANGDVRAQSTNVSGQISPSGPLALTDGTATASAGANQTPGGKNPPGPSPSPSSPQPSPVNPPIPQNGEQAASTASPSLGPLPSQSSPVPSARASVSAPTAAASLSGASSASPASTPTPPTGQAATPPAATAPAQNDQRDDGQAPTPAAPTNDAALTALVQARDGARALLAQPYDATRGTGIAPEAKEATEGLVAHLNNQISVAQAGSRPARAPAQTSPPDPASPDASVPATPPPPVPPAPPASRETSAGQTPAPVPLPQARTSSDVAGSSPSAEGSTPVPAGQSPATTDFHQSLADAVNRGAPSQEAGLPPTATFRALTMVRDAGGQVTPDVARQVDNQVQAIRNDPSLPDNASKTAALKKLVASIVPAEQHTDTGTDIAPASSAPAATDSAGNALAVGDPVKLTNQRGDVIPATVQDIAPGGDVSVKSQGYSLTIPRAEIDSRPTRMVKVASPDAPAVQPSAPSAPGAGQSLAARSAREPVTQPGKFAKRLIATLTAAQAEGRPISDYQAAQLPLAREALDRDLNRQVLGANPQPTTPAGIKAQAKIQRLSEARDAGAQLAPSDHAAWTNAKSILERDFTAQRQAIEARQVQPPAAPNGPALSRNEPAPAANPPANSSPAPTAAFREKQAVVYRGRDAVVEHIDGDRAVVRVKAGQDPKTGQNLTAKRVRDVPLSSLTTKAPTITPKEAPYTGAQALATAQAQIHANRAMLRGMGVTDVRFGPTVAASGVEIGGDGILRVSPAKLANSMTAVRNNRANLGTPGTPEEWFSQVLVHEGIHAADAAVARAKGQTIQQRYEALPAAAMPQGWQEAGQQVHGEQAWKAMPEWQKKAEFVRQVIEGKWTGRITEALHKFIQQAVDFLKGVAGFKDADPRFKAHVEEVESRFAAASQDTDAPAAGQPRPGGRVAYGRRAAVVQSIDGETARIQLKGSSKTIQVPVADLKPPIMRRFILPSTATGQPDIIDHIAENGGMRGSEAAKRIAAGKGLTDGVGGDYDDRPNLKPGVYTNTLFGGHMTPDQMASALHEDYGHGDGTTPTMYREIDRAMQSRESGRAELQRQAEAGRQSDRFERDALTQGTAKGGQEVNASSLSVGDQVQVGGQTLKVVDVDPDSVTLEDHSKYGKQQVADGQTLYVEQVQPADGDDASLAASRPDTQTGDLFGGGDDPFNLRGDLASPAERVAAAKAQANPPAPTATPTLRSGEKGTGDLFQGDDQPFNLMGETGIDHGARQAASEQAERETAAARAIQERQQGTLFASQPERQPYPASLFEKGSADNRKAQLLREAYALGELSHSNETGLWARGPKTARVARQLVDANSEQTLAEQRATLDREKANLARSFARAGNPKPLDSLLTGRESRLKAKEDALARFESPTNDSGLLAATNPEDYRPATPDERERLGIPPAWTDVHIAIDPNARRIAVGKDDKGRIQSRYSEAHTAAADAEKFNRGQQFHQALPAIMARVQDSLATGNGREEAAVLRLIHASAFRNGGDDDTGAKVKAYGASNLRAEHVKFDGDTTHFDFTGKLGVRQQHSITDAALTADLRQRAAAGGALFNTNDAKVRAYLQRSGKFKVHDFRTWNATDLARQEVAKQPTPSNAMQFWIERARIGDLAAEKLGDTRKVVLDSYIDPTVFEPWKSALGITNEKPPALRQAAGAPAARRASADRPGSLPADVGLLRDQLVPDGPAAGQAPAGAGAARGLADGDRLAATDPAAPLSERARIAQEKVDTLEGIQSRKPLQPLQEALLKRNREIVAEESAKQTADAPADSPSLKEAAPDIRGALREKIAALRRAKQGVSPDLTHWLTKLDGRGGFMANLSPADEGAAMDSLRALDQEHGLGLNLPDPGLMAATAPEEEDPLFTPSSRAQPPAPAKKSALSNILDRIIGTPEHRAAVDAISAGKDAVDTMAGVSGRQAKTAVRLDIPDDLDRQAAGPVVEAGYDPRKLAADLAKVQASPDPKLVKQYAPIYQRAIDNLPRLRDAAEGWRQRDVAEDAAAERARLTPQAIARERHIYDDPTSPESTIATDKGFGATKGFRTAAEAIAAGVDPKSTDLGDLAERRVQRNQRAINEHTFHGGLASMKAADGKPILSAIQESDTKLNADGKPFGTAKTPPGYETVQAGSNVLTVHKEFAPLVKALYGESAFQQNRAGNAVLNVAAIAKHGTAIFDSYHAARVLAKEALGFQTVGYDKGLAALDYAAADRPRAVKAGLISQEEADWANRHDATIQRGLKAGLNVGKVSDNLLEAAKQANFFEHLPVVGKALTAANELIFHKLTRGAMTQAFTVAVERNTARFPELSQEEIDRRSAKEVNEFFGNLGSQGLFKSKTLQDAARVIGFAPQWTESQFRSEARGYGQAARAGVDAMRGKGFRLGVVAQAMAGTALAGLVAAQALNLFTRGKSTWHNPEEGHGWDAWLPGGPHNRGFWFSPLTIAAEYAHELHKYMEGGQNALDAVAHIASNKLSGPARAVKDLVTGKDANGQPFGSTRERLTAAATDALPFPIPASGLLKRDPKSAVGYSLNRQPGSGEKQLLGMAGVKVDAAQSPRAQMYQVAQAYKKPGAGGGEHGPSAYGPLRQALDNQDRAGTEDAIRQLLQDGKTLPAIAKALGLKNGSAAEIEPELFTGSRATELQMFKHLTPAQRQTYQQAQRDRGASARLFAQWAPTLLARDADVRRMASANATSERQAKAASAAAATSAAPVAGIPTLSTPGLRRVVARRGATSR